MKHRTPISTHFGHAIVLTAWLLLVAVCAKMILRMWRRIESEILRRFEYIRRTEWLPKWCCLLATFCVLLSWSCSAGDGTGDNMSTPAIGESETGHEAEYGSEPDVTLGVEPGCIDSLLKSVSMQDQRVRRYEFDRCDNRAVESNDSIVSFCQGIDATVHVG